MIIYIILGIVLGLLVVVSFFREKRLKDELDTKNELLDAKNESIRCLEIDKTRLETENTELRLKAERVETLSESEKKLSINLQDTKTQLESSQKRLEQVSEELKVKNDEISSMKDKMTSKLEEYAVLETTLNKERKQTEEKLKLLEETKENLKLEFENLANKIFEAKSEKLTITSKESLDKVLNPFKQQITDFKKRIDDVYDKESEERGFLKKEIADLKKLNERLSEDALNLTTALKGDKKYQGNWGEVQLQRLLEFAGLTEGIEYETQATHKDEEGETFRPDVIVHLPQEKDIVIDSKVSLVAYSKFCSEDDPILKQKALDEHVSAIKNHIKLLGAKSYQNLKGINTLDFVIMFLPIEASYFVAINENRELFQEALNKNIIIVCPSTLLMTLKTIHNIWKYEHQNRNAKDIADRGRLLYNKFRGFVETLNALGNKLESANKEYDRAINQLSEGKGNLITQANELIKLGIQPDKMLDKALVEKAEANSIVEGEIENGSY